MRRGDYVTHRAMPNKFLDVSVKTLPTSLTIITHGDPACLASSHLPAGCVYRDRKAEWNINSSL